MNKNEEISTNADIHYDAKSYIVRLIEARLIKPVSIGCKSDKEISLIPIISLILDLEQFANKRIRCTDLIQHAMPFVIRALCHLDIKSETIKYEINGCILSLECINEILTLIKLNTFTYINPMEMFIHDVVLLEKRIIYICDYYNIDYYTLKEEVEHHE